MYFYLLKLAILFRSPPSGYGTSSNSCIGQRADRCCLCGNQGGLGLWEACWWWPWKSCIPRQTGRPGPLAETLLPAGPGPAVPTELPSSVDGTALLRSCGAGPVATGETEQMGGDWVSRLPGLTARVELAPGELSLLWRPPRQAEAERFPKGEPTRP